jgi:hypothetical protein
MVYLRARWYAMGVGRFTQPDPGAGDRQQPISLQPYLYAGDNPVNYTDPSGQSRVAQLYSIGTGLLRFRQFNPMYRFISFMQFAASLYSDMEVDQYMIDVTELLHGIRYDPNLGRSFLQQSMGMYQPKNPPSPYFLGGQSFNDPEDLEQVNGSMPYADMGWATQYWDHLGNQAYHFWFYVALAYFDGEIPAGLGNFVHDGYETALGKIYQCTVGNTLGRVFPIRLHTGPGVSRQDYDLGVQGARLGSALMRWNLSFVSDPPSRDLGVRPSQVADWIRNNLASASYADISY